MMQCPRSSYVKTVLLVFSMLCVDTTLGQLRPRSTQTSSRFHVWNLFHEPYGSSLLHGFPQRIAAVTPVNRRTESLCDVLSRD
jgi:hypothetical protein